MSTEYDILRRAPILRKPSDEVPELEPGDAWKGQHFISISAGDGLRDGRNSRNRLDEK